MSDPTSPDTADAADRAWFHSHVDPVVRAEPVPDAWPAIESRLDETALASSTPARRPPTRWVAIAAVIALLGALAAVVVAHGDDDATSVVSDRGDRNTGWYIPRDLPEGWSLLTVDAVATTYCEGSNQSWKREPSDLAGRPSLDLDFVACIVPEPEPTGEPGPALGHGIDRSTLVDTGDGATNEITWESEGMWTLTGRGVTDDELIAAARAVVADPTSEDAPLPSFEPSGSGASEGAEPDGRPGLLIRVVLTTPEGSTASYLLYPPGQGSLSSPVRTDSPHPVAGQPNPLVLREFVTMTRMGADPMRTGTLFGAWPDADIQIPLRIRPSDDQRNDDGRHPTAEKKAADRLIDDLAGSLRPATAEEWRAFVATSSEPSEDPRLQAPTLAAAEHGDVPEATTSGAGASSTTIVPTTTSSPAPPASTTTSAPAGSPPGRVLSSPGVAEASEHPSEMYSSLAGISFRLELPAGPIRADLPPTGTLVMENTTDRDIDLNECTQGLTQWGLVPADRPEAPLPQHNIIDCFDTPTMTVPAGRTARYPMDWRLEDGFSAQRTSDSPAALPGGTLEGGSYLAVVEIPGDTTTVRIELSVTVADPLCPTSDELVEKYVGLTRKQAEARAGADRLGFRVVRVDGDQQPVTGDLRCDRVSVDLWNDQVTNALRY